MDEPRVGSSRSTSIYKLNDDVLRLIFSELYLDSPLNLISTSRACRLFYLHSIPLLYQIVKLRRGANYDAATAYILNRITAPGSYLPGFIRELHFHGWGFATKGLWMAMPYEDELCKLAAQLLGKTDRHLTDVHWEDYVSSEIFGALRDHYPQGIRVHVRAVRIADAWPRMWAPLEQCHSQLTSLTLKRFNGSAVSLRELVKGCLNLEMLEVCCPDTARNAYPGQDSPHLLRFRENEPAPKLKSITLHNQPFSLGELHNWGAAGGWTRLESIDVDSFSYAAFHATGATATLNSICITDTRALLPNAQPYLLIFLSGLERCHTLHLASKLHQAPLAMLAGTAANLTTLHIHDREPRPNNVIRTADRSPTPALNTLRTDFPALTHLGLDLNWVPSRLFATNPSLAHEDTTDPSALPWDDLEQVAQLPRLTHLTLYGQSTTASYTAETAPPRLGPSTVEYIFDFLRRHKVGAPLQELVVLRGSKDLDYGRGLSLDQLQAVWERNGQLVYRCFVGEGGQVQVQARGFEEVWGRCDTTPNITMEQLRIDGEVGLDVEVVRSVYDQLCGGGDGVV